MPRNPEKLQKVRETLDPKGVEFFKDHKAIIFPDNEFLQKPNRPWFEASDSPEAGLHIDTVLTLPAHRDSRIENFFSNLVDYQRRIAREKSDPDVGPTFRLVDNEPLTIKLNSWEWFKAFLDISEMFPGTIIWGGRLERLNYHPISGKMAIG